MSVATATITSNGKAMDMAYQVLSIDIVREVNRIPYAQLTLIDGDAAKGTFPISDSGFFDPGKPVEIKLRIEGKPASEKTVFKGLVVAQSVEAENLNSVLTVDLKDEAVKLTQTPRSQVFVKLSDDQVVKKLIQTQGLKAGQIAATQPSHEEIVQYGCTDWDFILSRADVNGLLVCVVDGSISLQKIKLGSAAKSTFVYGIDEIYAFEIEANAQGQYGEVSSLGWDIKNQKLSAAKKGKDAKLSPGNLNGGTLAKAVGGASRVLACPAPAQPEELQSWSDATLARSRLGLVRGRISVPGLTGLKLLDTIEIKSIGKHFNGKALLTGWRHRVTEQGWITDLRLGLAADWFSSRPDVAAKPAAGLLPPVGGLHIGIVAGFEEDPEKEFRLKVTVPALGDGQPALWARLASPDAGKGRGFFFRPEPGDEVVLGFFNDDPRQPVVVGALYGSVNAPPKGFETLSDKNNLKGLVTKKGTVIGFDDKDDGKAAVYIETANKNKILLDDEAKSISLTDQHGNAITLDENGITIKSAKDLNFEVAGNLAVKCDGDTKLESSGKVEVTSSADLTLEASGNAVIKGSAVDIK